MRIGIAGFPIGCADKGAVGAVDYLIEKGLQAEELQFVRNVWMKQEGALALADHLKGEDFTLSIHGSYYINLCNPEKLKPSVNRIVSAMRTGESAGATLVVFHPGFYGSLSQGDAFDRVVEGVELIKKQTSGLKINIGLETTGKRSQFGTLEELIEVSNKTGTLPVIDFAHIHARSNGGLKEVNDFLEIFTTLESGLPKYAKRPHCHFSGIEFTEKGERRHLPISSKEPDFSILCKAIKKTGCDPTIICESPFLERDALLMREIAEKT
jgi:deoxyribonuclease-4